MPLAKLWHCQVPITGPLYLLLDAMQVASYEYGFNVYKSSSSPVKFLWKINLESSFLSVSLRSFLGTPLFKQSLKFFL
jgi:hypothetical protein